MQLQRGKKTRVLITGPDGFLGRNLLLRLSELNNVDCLFFRKSDNPRDLPSLVRSVDFIFHLAGVNRPENPLEFQEGNAELTRSLISAVEEASLKSLIPPTIIFASSTQAELNNPYGESKRCAEDYLFKFSKRTQAKVFVFRFPNIFGKWARPNFNSVVATFCHNISRDLPIQVNNPDALLSLVYIDDVMDIFMSLLRSEEFTLGEDGFAPLPQTYQTTVGELSRHLMNFKEGRDSLLIECVGSGYLHALYATYISYLPVEKFAYEIPAHSDSRGVFVEMLKTPDCGQFSFFTAHPGVTRGGHYHHSKIEKFLVIKGRALFRFRHMQTGETYQLESMGGQPKVVETIPGWTHDITNIGPDEMIAILWANEIFDPQRPDTQKSLIQ
ncbi:NAD-dependent epimerase/dehydratase family protein [Polynucleobacter sp. UK-Kesae-W10]|uniref:UDP-2-acetamido-2,6-beta-L-arabino-hexul-4-ose reductase n=1 Tax=Polynucleobacter sp. UK-Kesae-W10 TaxID=1819738 RepID=UPI001C0B24FD|nr:NAD-dependent epimerase/dehydratase family protein [Polynucleobacter sp. UK-Kesae-W10]MBU3576944.1 SDR family oxidoreductase [Polynucleobacter sp. UK-Kesae-W10]